MAEAWKMSSPRIFNVAGLRSSDLSGMATSSSRTGFTSSTSGCFARSGYKTSSKVGRGLRTCRSDWPEMLRAAAENSLNAAAFIKCIAKPSATPQRNCNNRDRSLSPVGFPFTGQEPASKGSPAGPVKPLASSSHPSASFEASGPLCLLGRCLCLRMQSILSQHQHAIRRCSGRMRVGHNNAGRTVRLYFRAHELEYILRRVRVEVAGRFVGENQFRTVHQCTGDGDALQLSTRELARKMVSPAAQNRQSLQHLVVRSTMCSEGKRRSAASGSATFWFSVEMRQDVECLKDKSKLPAAQPGGSIITLTTKWLYRRSMSPPHQEHPNQLSDSTGSICRRRTPP